MIAALVLSILIAMVLSADVAWMRDQENEGWAERSDQPSHLQTRLHRIWDSALQLVRGDRALSN